MGHQSALDRRTTKHLLFLPASRISSTTTHTFAENNEPFFVVVHALVVRSVLPLVVNYIRAWYIHRVRWRSRLKTRRRYAGEITFLVLVLLK